MSSVRATTALSLRGTEGRGQRQEIARQAPGPHLEMQAGERLGGDLIPFRGQSGSRVFASLLRVALGAAPHPACKHGACAWSCPSSVAQRDSPAQSQPSCDGWVTLRHLHHVSASELKLLWIPPVSQGSSLSANTFGSFLPLPSPTSFHLCFRHYPEDTLMAEWPKMSWVGESTGSGRAACLWSKKHTKNSMYLVLELWGSRFQIEQRWYPDDSPHCCFLLLWIYFNPKDPGELLLRAGDILSEVRNVTSWVFVICLWKSGGFSQSSMSEKDPDFLEFPSSPTQTPGLEMLHFFSVLMLLWCHAPGNEWLV